MALEPPVLDKREFEDLLAEAKRRIVRYAPEWTDFNDSDPGMTLVQLFAWFTETLLHQMNRVPELHYVRFLDMLGFRPEPAKPASAVIVFAVPENPPANLPQLVPAWTRSAPIPAPDGRPVVFNTTLDLSLIRRPLTRLVRRSPDGAKQEDLTQLNLGQGREFLPFGDDGAVGSELRLGFLASANDTRAEDAFPEELHFHVRIASGATRPPVQRRVVPPTFQEKREVVEHLRHPHASRAVPRLAWAALLGPGSPTDREPLAVIEDETAGFTRCGYLRLRRPRRARAFADPGDAPACFWLACRIEERGFPFGTSPRLSRVSVNAVPAVALETIRDEQLGPSDGMPDQVFRLSRTPVSLETIRSVAVGGESWRVVNDLLRSGTDERHVGLDPGAGELRFGDGTHGRIPPAGEPIVVPKYRAGGGVAGNVPAESIRFTVGIDGTNPDPAEGGTDAESVDRVKREAPARVRHLDRAVTPEDYADIARTVSGVARARAIPLRHPDFPDTEVAGSVTVFVVPPVAEGQRHPPVTTDDELDRVTRELERRRLAGTELFVAPARLVAVRVQADVEPVSGLAWSEVEGYCLSALHTFLNSPERGFGEPIRPARLLAELARVPGVAAIPQLYVDVLQGVAGKAVRRGHDLTDLKIPVAPDAVMWGLPSHRLRPTRGNA